MVFYVYSLKSTLTTDKGHFWLVGNKIQQLLEENPGH